MLLEDVKNYLRVSENDDDLMIQTLIDTSIQYIQNSTGKKYVAGNLVYEQCIKFLVSHWYDQRGIVAEKSLVQIPFSVSLLMAHIAVCGEYPEVE